MAVDASDDRRYPRPSNGPTAEDGDIDFRQILNVLRSGKWLILGCTLGALVAGFLYVRAQTPIYRGDALLQIEQRGGGNFGITDLVGLTQGLEPIGGEIEIMRSRSVVSSVVDQLELDLAVAPVPKSWFGSLLAQAQAVFGDSGSSGPVSIDVERFDIPSYRVGERFTLLVQGSGAYTLYDRRGIPLLSGRVGEPAPSGSAETGSDVGIFVSAINAPPGTQFYVQRRSWESAVVRLAGALSIQEVGRATGIVRVSLDGPDRAILRSTLDALTVAYVRQNQEQKSEEARRSVEFINSQLPILQARLQTAQEEYNQFRATQQSVDLTAETIALMTESSNVNVALGNLEIERVRLGVQLGPEHPQILALNEQERSLLTRRDDLDTRIGTLPEREQQALQLRRNVDVADQLYTNLLIQKSGLEVAQAGTVGSARIVDTALVRGSPVQPRPRIVLMMSLVLGFTVGVGGVFGRHFLRSTVHDPDQLESRFGLPVYAVVPHSTEEDSRSRRAKRHRGNRLLLAAESPEDVTIESIRSLRTSLHFALMDTKRRVVMVTSPGPGSGKSFLCANLAWLIADSDQRVLLIDADMRRGHLHNYVGRGRKPGLTEVLSGQMSLHEAVAVLRPDGQVNLLTTGTTPPNPSELLMSPQFEELLAVASTQYDLVVIDTPPVLAVTDAAVIGPSVGAVFMLVRAGVTGLGEIDPAIKRLRRNGAVVNGFIVNDLKRGQGSAATPYYYYHYNYSTRKGD